MASIINVSNETKGSSTRITREGRKITYRLTVIQQPERARACGQGAKAATDRRPVDPPPIVELRVVDGEGEHAPDITFSYGANFFLYTTLENARTIAHGRMPQPSNNSPVLTGMPVAGMCYLDRPSPAGYFTFPDLSVRHEGKYRMKFTLYEELKDPKDFDMEQKEPLGQNTNLDSDTNVGAARARCDVHSAPFNVFSAKKFPGLNESTPLSRLVADQGCRVRIRRDVRMRRRDPKDSKDWDKYEDDTAELRARQTETPDTYKQGAAGTPHPEQAQRPRSMSNATNASYHAQSQRPLQRTASQEVVYQHGMAPQHSAPPTPQHGLAPGYNNYEQHPGYASHYLQQQQQHPEPVSPHQMPPQFAQGPQQGGYSAYQQPPLMHMQPGYAYPVHMAQQHGMYEQQRMNTAHYQQSQHPGPVDPRSPVAIAHPQQAEYNYNPIHAPQQQAHPTLPAAHQASAGQPVHSHRSMDSISSAHPKHEPASPTSYNPPNYHAEASLRPPPSQYVTAPTAAGAPAPKRSYGAVFNTAHTEGSLRSGARPTTDYATHSGVGLGLITGMGANIDDGNNSDEEMELNMSNMSYRRADGRSVRVPWSRSN